MENSGVKVLVPAGELLRRTSSLGLLAMSQRTPATTATNRATLNRIGTELTGREDLNKVVQPPTLLD